jgi:hypothetical protein
MATAKTMGGRLTIWSGVVRRSSDDHRNHHFVLMIFGAKQPNQLGGYHRSTSHRFATVLLRHPGEHFPSVFRVGFLPHSLSLPALRLVAPQAWRRRKARRSRVPPPSQRGAQPVTSFGCGLEPRWEISGQAGLLENISLVHFLVRFAHNIGPTTPHLRPWPSPSQ